MFKKNSNTPSPTPLYLDLHSHTQYSAADTLVLRNRYPLTADPTLPFSVGIHPWFLDNWQAQLDAVVTLASHPNCWAIGECGIDKNTSTPLPLQQQIFTEQIAIAEALQKPLIIHCVKAYSEVIALRQRTHARQLWVLHGFRQNLPTYRPSSSLSRHCPIFRSRLAARPKTTTSFSNPLPTLPRLFFLRNRRCRTKRKDPLPIC